MRQTCLNILYTIILVACLILSTASYDNSEKLANNKIKDSIANIISKGIINNEFPGGQIIVVRKGILILDSCFGYTSYDKKKIVNNSTLYDLASLTKCMGTTLMAMNLYDNNKFDDSKPLAYYVYKYNSRDVGHIPMTRFFTHSTGLVSSLVLHYKLVEVNGNDAIINNWFKGILHNKQFGNYKRYYGKSGKDDLYIYDSLKYSKYASVKSTKTHNLKLAKNLYIKPEFYNIVDSLIRKAKTRDIGDKMYSDINFFYIKKALESIAKMPINDYLSKKVYSKFGLTNICYHPLMNGFSRKNIAPTERDYIWRNEMIHGTVHDEFAAILGGIGGNAGLFSNAQDLLPLCIELMDKRDGVFSAKTKSHFLSQPYIEEENYWSLGFKKVKGNDYYNSTSFGHSGFTGVFFQIDQSTENILIFLSNSIHPSRKNLKPIKERSSIRIWQLLRNEIVN